MFLVMTFGVAHALLYLPIILTLFGPTTHEGSAMKLDTSNYKNDNTNSEKKQFQNEMTPKSNNNNNNSNNNNDNNNQKNNQNYDTDNENQNEIENQNETQNETQNSRAGRAAGG